MGRWWSAARSLRFAPKRAAVALVAAAVLVGVSAAPTDAHDHKVPRARLISENATQASYRYESVWLRRARDPRWCLRTHTINFNTFPSAIPHPMGEAAVIRIRKQTPPLLFEIRTWNHIDRQGRPKGTPQEVPFILRPRFGDGPVVAWDATFVPVFRSRDLYIQVDAHWRDEEHCHDFEPDVGSQWVAWRFHLRRAPPTHVDHQRPAEAIVHSASN